MSLKHAAPLASRDGRGGGGGGGYQLDASQWINAVALAEKKGNCRQALALQEGV